MTERQMRLIMENSQCGIERFKGLTKEQKEMPRWCLQRGLSSYNEHLKKHIQK